MTGTPSRRTVYVPDQETLLTRPARVETVFREYYTRPMVRYNDPYSGFFWWWLLDRSLEDRARSLTSVGLSESDTFLFAVFADEKRYPSESVIFREGEAGDAIYVLARGRVRISRHISGG